MYHEKTLYESLYFGSNAAVKTWIQCVAKDKTIYESNISLGVLGIGIVSAFNKNDKLSFGRGHAARQ